MAHCELYNAQDVHHTTGLEIFAHSKVQVKEFQVVLNSSIHQVDNLALYTQELSIHNIHNSEFISTLRQLLDVLIIHQVIVLQVIFQAVITGLSIVVDVIFVDVI